MLLVAATANADRNRGTDGQPLCVVSLGERIESVKQRSTMFVNSQALQDNDVLVVQEPNTFVYDSSLRGFQLPGARYVTIHVVLGVVASIQVSPQVEYFNLEQALAKAAKLKRLFDEAGWSPDTRVKHLRTNEELRKEFAAKDSDPRLKDGIGFWKNGDEELYVMLERKHRADEAYARSLGYQEDKYLLMVYLSNPRLLRELSDQLISNKMDARSKQ